MTSGWRVTAVSTQTQCSKVIVQLKLNLGNPSNENGTRKHHMYIECRTLWKGNAQSIEISVWHSTAVAVRAVQLGNRETVYSYVSLAHRRSSTDEVSLEWLEVISHKCDEMPAVIRLTLHCTHCHLDLHRQVEIVEQLEQHPICAMAKAWKIAACWAVVLPWKVPVEGWTALS